MSATNRGGSRDQLDRYYTPPELARAIVRHADVPCPRTIIEPNVGGGAFALAARARWPEAYIVGVDVDPRARGLALCDFSRRADVFHSALDRERADLVIGNPPFRNFEAHVDRALDFAPDVIFLLRLAALEGGGRWGWHASRGLRRVTVLSERPSFTGGGTDNCAYGVFHFVRGHRGTADLDTLSWRPYKKLRGAAGLAPGGET